MSSKLNILTSPANSIASSGIGAERPKVISPNATKKKSVYRHEPYNSGILLVPSQDGLAAQRVVYSLTTPTQHASHPTRCMDDAHITASGAVLVSPHSHATRHTTLSSISTDSLEGPISPINSSTTTHAHGSLGECNQSSGGLVDEHDVSSMKQAFVGPIRVSSGDSSAPCVYNSHYNTSVSNMQSNTNRMVCPPPQQLQLQLQQQRQPPYLLPAHLTAPRELMSAPTTIPAGSVVVVAFKYGKKKFNTAFPLELNQFVVVEGDRGIDMGLVEDFITFPSAADFHLPSVIRRPTPQDMERHRQRFEHEAEAVRRLRGMCAEHGKELNFFPEAIRDVMFQLDSKKITLIIFRENNKYFFDFRTFQRQVFEAYRCRVWFSYLDEIEQTMSTDNKKPPRAPRGSFTRKGKGKTTYTQLNNSPRMNRGGPADMVQNTAHVSMAPATVLAVAQH